MITFKIPYGKKKITFEIPSESNVTLVKTKSNQIITDIAEATKHTLTHPINSKRLSEILEIDNTVCVIVTDITRNCPDREILPPLIEEIKTKIKPSNLKLLIASGMHRQMSYAEKAEKYGEKIINNYQIFDHDAKDDKNLVSLGTTKNGTPIKISKSQLELWNHINMLVIVEDTKL